MKTTSPIPAVTDIANGNPELDAIVAGHMHTLIDKAVVNGVIITEPDKYGRALSRIDLQFEEQNGKFTLINKDSLTYKIKDITSDSKWSRSTSLTINAYVKWRTAKLPN